MLLKRRQGRAIANFDRVFIPYWRCCVTETSSAYGCGNWMKWIRSENSTLEVAPTAVATFFFRWPWTLIYDPDLGIWPTWGQAEPTAPTIYRVAQKFGTIILYALTLPNIRPNRFSKLFHYQNQEKIWNYTITKDPTTPQVCRYTTLWNVKCLKSNNWKQDDFCNNTF